MGKAVNKSSTKTSGSDGPDSTGKPGAEIARKAVAEGAGKPATPKPGKGKAVVSFFANLLRADRYKPTQGKHARLWSAIGLGALVGAGLYTFHAYYLQDSGRIASTVTPMILALIGAWIIWRIVEYPPFADFLIATEAEMNKVSWTTWDDLKRSTMVVLATVLVISLFLFGVDWLWSLLLQVLGVLKFNGGGAFGSQAG